MPSEASRKRRSQETQDAIDILDVRLTHIVDTLSRQPTGWTKVLSAAFATLTTKGGNENTLNYATQDLIDEGEAFSGKASDYKEQLKTIKNESVPNLDSDVTKLYESVVEYTKKAYDQAGGLQNLARDLDKKSRDIYQKNYQRDVGRVEFLQKGTHGERIAKRLTEFWNVIKSSDDLALLGASALGKYFNPKVEDMRMSQVLLFDAEHAKAAFPNFYSYRESGNEYIEGRVKDARAALENDPSTPGSFSQLEGFGIADDLFHPIGTLTNLDKPGAQGQVVCSRGGAKREGALAVPLAGMASVISPIDEPIIVTITNIGTITQISGITLGSSYCKWLETGGGVCQPSRWGGCESPARLRDPGASAARRTSRLRRPSRRPRRLQATPPARAPPGCTGWAQRRAAWAGADGGGQQ